MGDSERARHVGQEVPRFEPALALQTHAISLPDNVRGQHPSQLRGLPRGPDLDQRWEHNLGGVSELIRPTH